MGVQLIPSSSSHEELRINESVPYRIYYTPAFPLSKLNGKLDKDYQGAQKWIMGLLADIREAGCFRNPVIVWQHHKTRGVKQPHWLLRAGSNRVWCAEQLGWTHVPAVVTTDTDPLDFLADYEEIYPRDLPRYFPDGGKPWANDFGIGLLAAKKPEETYASYEADPRELLSVTPTEHNRQKIIPVI